MEPILRVTLNISKNTNKMSEKISEWACFVGRMMAYPLWYLELPERVFAEWFKSVRFTRFLRVAIFRQPIVQFFEVLPKLLS